MGEKKMKEKIVLALGGNAIIKKGQKGTISEQFDNTMESMKRILPIIKLGYKIIITHGNGPTVGHMMVRVEAGLERAPYIPLGLCVADSQGGLGYMIALCLRNVLFKAKIAKEIVPLITPVLVSENDKSLKNPTKPIGSFYTQKEAEKIGKLHKDWIIKEGGNREWRRVVPSPKPLEILNKHIIQEMIKKNYIVIAAGGGGIPVIHLNDKTLKGIPAVIDKDRTAAILARDVNAEILMILTAVDKIYLDYGTKKQRGIHLLSAARAKTYLKQGHFPEGSMGPKIEAAVEFLEQGGKEAIICGLNEPDLALAGKTGTKIIP